MTKGNDMGMNEKKNQNLWTVVVNRLEYDSRFRSFCYRRDVLKREGVGVPGV